MGLAYGCRRYRCQHLQAFARRSRRFVARKHDGTLCRSVPLRLSSSLVTLTLMNLVFQVTRNKKLISSGKDPLTKDLARVYFQSTPERMTTKLSSVVLGPPTRTDYRNSLVRSPASRTPRLSSDTEIPPSRLTSYLPRVLHGSGNSRPYPSPHRMGNAQERYLPLEPYDPHWTNLRARHR